MEMPSNSFGQVIKQTMPQCSKEQARKVFETSFNYQGSKAVTVKVIKPWSHLLFILLNVV